MPRGLGEEKINQVFIAPRPMKSKGAASPTKHMIKMVGNAAPYPVTLVFHHESIEYFTSEVLNLFSLQLIQSIKTKPINL